ncbi:uncharacterized protein [Typha angustifolia]|uniref:uncharacterized protein n=1 Tax=Typha angustifolia TaxID=59011 RepID=UPI003C2FE991
MFHSSFRYVHRFVRAVRNPISTIQPKGHPSQQLTQDDQRGREFLNQAIPYTTQRTWHTTDVPLVPYAGWVFFSKNISWLYSWLQVSSAIACVTLSLIRLIEQDYGVAKEESTNWKLALNLFYGMALAEALIFMVEETYWIWKFSSKLLEQVSEDCGLGSSGVVCTRRFFYDAYTKCISGSIFDSLKMDFVTFAEELLYSDSHDEQLIGARILQSFVKSNQFAFETIRKIGSSTKIIERLIEMLNWKNREEEDIRRCAAEILSKLAGKRPTALRIAGIPGSMQSISSLLHKGRSTVGRNHESNQRAVIDDESDYDFSDFNNLGLLILKKLASDHNNCEKIGNVRGTLPKIIDFISASQSLLCNEHAPVSQIKAVKRSLQVVKMLVNTTGSTGKMLRKEISEIVFTVSSIREILQHGERHQVLQKLGIEILTSLAMDETAKERIGGTGGIIKLLLSIFFRQDITYDKAGEALAMLALESKKNCIMILKETDVLERLVCALNDPLLQLNALRILRNLSAYSGTESAGRLSGVIAALPTVLKSTMIETDKLLQASLGLTIQICKFMGPEDFAGELEQVGIRKTDFAKRLINILKQYKYPDIEVPRIRRSIVQLAIWMMKSEPYYIEVFKNFEMEKLLETMADTTSDLECFHVFSGNAGLSQQREHVSSLLDTALELLTNGSSAQNMSTIPIM